MNNIRSIIKSLLITIPSSYIIFSALKIPLPPILEPISWLIGHWETETSTGDRFPVSFEQPYKEVLDISLSEVAMFDRPSLNVSLVFSLSQYFLIQEKNKRLNLRLSYYSTLFFNSLTAYF